MAKVCPGYKYKDATILFACIGLCPAFEYKQLGKFRELSAVFRLRAHFPAFECSVTAAMVLLAAGVTGLGGWLLAMFLAYRYQRHVYPGPLGDRELREHPSIGWVSFALLMMTGWMITIACSRMHCWLMRDKRLDVLVPKKTL